MEKPRTWSDGPPASKRHWGILGSINGLRVGLSSRCDLEKSARRVVALADVAGLKVRRNLTPFDRRVTSMAWHPLERNLVAVGSKGGDVLLWNCEREGFETLVTVQSPGGSIQSVKFDAHNPSRVYTCSIDGTLSARTFLEGQGNDREAFKEVLLDAGGFERWYTSFDVDYSGHNLLVGDNNGRVTLMTSGSGHNNNKEAIWTKRLHKNKVTNISYSDRQPWQFVTASVDATVKIWDIRGDLEKKPLQELVHDKPVNLAEFNPLDGSKLLTTDQHSQIRIYSASCPPSWRLERLIHHPHRQFQHLTPIKAVWHPLVDLVVVGRYPDPKLPGHVPGELRTIDFIDADSGETVYQLSDPATQNKIVSLNRFSPSGDALLSGAGLSVLLWKKLPPPSSKGSEMTVTESSDGKGLLHWSGYSEAATTKSAKKKTTKNK